MTSSVISINFCVDHAYSTDPKEKSDHIVIIHCLDLSLLRSLIFFSTLATWLKPSISARAAMLRSPLRPSNGDSTRSDSALTRRWVQSSIQVEHIYRILLPSKAQAPAFLLSRSFRSCGLPWRFLLRYHSLYKGSALSQA